MNTADKKTKIISYLNNQSNWTTAKSIADHLNMSIRSVKTYIADINKQYDLMISSSNHGYKINKELAKIALEEKNENSIPKNYDERKRAIILKTLMEKQRPSISDLSDALCISPITLLNELSRIRNDLAPYHLNVHIRNDILSITGLSKDKRTVISTLIKEEIQESYFSLQHIQSIFTNVDLSTIEKIVTQILNKHEYFLDSYELFNYVLHLALSIEIRTDIPEDISYPIESGISILKFGSKDIREIINEIYLALSKQYGNTSNFTFEDIVQASVLMITRVVSNNINSISSSEIGVIFGIKTKKLLEEIIESVQNTYCLNLADENFMIRFAFHLNNLLIRLKYNIKISNLQFKSIKNDFPLIYAISVHISNVIYEFCGYSIPEAEIAYIALHVGVLMEEYHSAKEKINAIVVCPNYYMMGQKIFKTVSGIFSKTMLITNVVTSIQEDTDLSNVDLILTTQPLCINVSVPYYVVEPFVTEANIQQIFHLIDELKQSKIKKVFSQKIQYFFHKDLFFVNEHFQTDTDAIEAMCDRMIEHGYVEKNYKEEIYDHEKISPSSYANIAIPHPLNNRAKNSVIAISLNPVPIQWGFNKVYLVFMLSLKEEDRDLFSDIFDFITKIINDETIFRRLINLKTYDEFVNELISLY